MSSYLSRAVFVGVILGVCVSARILCADELDKKQQSAFPDYGLPFVQKYCVRCHGEKEPKADLSLHAFRDEASVVKNRKTCKNWAWRRPPCVKPGLRIRCVCRERSRRIRIV